MLFPFRPGSKWGGYKQKDYKCPETSIASMLSRGYLYQQLLLAAEFFYFHTLGACCFQGLDHDFLHPSQDGFMPPEQI